MSLQKTKQLCPQIEYYIVNVNLLPEDVPSVLTVLNTAATERNTEQNNKPWLSLLFCSVHLLYRQIELRSDWMRWFKVVLQVLRSLVIGLWLGSAWHTCTCTCTALGFMGFMGFMSFQHLSWSFLPSVLSAPFFFRFLSSINTSWMCDSWVWKHYHK